MNRIMATAFVLGIALTVSAIACDEHADGEPGRWASIVQQYGSLGEHRSGTAVDAETSLWLQSELQARGMSATTQEWPLRVFQLRDSHLESVGEEIEAFPFWYPVTTGPAGLEAPLVNADKELKNELAGAIALLRLPPGQIEMHYDVAPLLQQVAANGAVGAVVILDHPMKAVSAQNAVQPHHREALPLPALIAAEADAASLLSLAEKKAVVRLVLDGTDLPGVAANVIGRMERGVDRWVVISTPISGWFEVTNERGPGIALWLQLAQWAVDSDLKANFLFTGLSGHELEKMGMAVLMESCEVPRPEAVALWLHLGSGIAVQTPLLAAVSSTQSLSDTVEHKLINTTAMTYWPEEKMPKGSEQYIALQRGYPVVGLFGADPAIHTRLDQAVRVDDQEYKRVLSGLQELIRSQVASGSDTDEEAP